MDDKTFTFLQKSPWRPAFTRRMSPSSPPRTGSSCKIHLKLSLSTNNTLKWGFAKQPLTLFPKIPQDPSTPPTPSRLLLPGYSPPLRPPAGLQDGEGWGDLLSFSPLITAPPPVPHSLKSHSSKLISSVHQNWPLKVFNIHSFCHLSVQAA